GYEVTYHASEWPPEEVHSVRLVERCDGVQCRWLERPESFYSGVGYGQHDGCRHLERTTNKAYAALQSQLAELIDVPPNEIVTCRVQDFDRVYVARYASLERDGEWNEDAEVACAVEDLETSAVPECRVAVIARNAKTRDAFGLSLGLRLSVAFDLRELGRQR